MELAFTVFTLFFLLMLFVGLLWLAGGINRRIRGGRERTATEERLIAEAQMHRHNSPRY